MVEAAETGIDTNEAVLQGLSYEYSWIFDREHIVELYQVCQMHPGFSALELGSYRGYCALAMALAGKQVTTIDISDKHLPTRTQLIEEHQQQDRVTFLIESSDDELELPRTFDIVLHDNARRGAALITELTAYWRRKLSPGGLLIVHNVEQIDLPSLVRKLEPESQIVTTDHRNRQLGFFAKPAG